MEGRIVDECEGCGKIKGKTCKVLTDPLWVWEKYGCCWAWTNDDKWESKVKEDVRAYAEVRGLSVKFIKGGDVKLAPFRKTA